MLKHTVVFVGLFLAVVTAAAAAPPEVRVLCPDPLPDQYIVAFKPGTFRTPKLPAAAPTVRDLASEIALVHGGQIVHVYENTVEGFAARIDAAAAHRMARDPRVAFVEQSCPIYPAAVQTSPGWGLDRIDETDTPLDARYEYNETGSGVNIYIIDTGITPNTTEFGTRLKTGKSFVPGKTTTIDEYQTNGHGTGVASIAAGSVHGAAKAANLYSYRIFGGTGDPLTGTAEAKAAVDWLIANHVKPAVANMSFYQNTVTGGVPISSFDQAVKNAVAAGIVMVASANNQNANACNYTPSKIPEVVTVGATTSSDARASFSNFGTCVDLWAPGETVAMRSRTGAVITNSGTSFSAPYVSGAAALFLQTNPTSTPATVANYLTSQATPNTLTGLMTGSPNLLLFAKPGHGCFSWTCTVSTKTCTFNATCSRMALGLGNYSWDFGDGTTGWTGSTSITHTFPTSDIYSVQLTVVPWYAQADTETGCVNVTGVGLLGCYQNGTTEQ